MSETKIATVEDGKAVAAADGAAILELVVVQGDLGRLTAGERVAYYRRVCESLGVNPFTKPFEYITLNGKLTLYARRDATDQLRKRHGVTVTGLTHERLDDLFIVTARVRDADGREDTSIGAVSIAGLRGEALANAMMKAETKAKRRATLSIVGLGWLDETEVGSIPDARIVAVDAATGEIAEPEPPRKPPALPSPSVQPPRPAAVPTHPATRADVEARYRKLLERADSLMVPADMLSNAWSAGELTDRGRDLAARIAAREGELASTAGAR